MAVSVTTEQLLCLSAQSRKLNHGNLHLNRNYLTSKILTLKNFRPYGALFDHQ